VRYPDIIQPGYVGIGDLISDAAGPAQSAAVSPSPAWLDTIKNVALTVLQTAQQKKVLDLQLARAKAGQPPLDIQDYMGDASIRGGLDNSTQRMVFITVGALVGGLLLFKVLGRR
jgi:hypothetical protein